ncbi:hypothetical protein Btru_035956 [Bulinus truncatus]|nr:hypothetical protein Btru_035956 [Bulinus truncatus]
MTQKVNLHLNPLLMLENTRLETYDKWPNKRSWFCTPEKLAKSGFYFSPGHESPDNVCCAFCAKELDCWDPNDDPMVEHKKHSPECPFLALNCPVENLTVEQFLRLVKEVTTFRASHHFDKLITAFESQAGSIRQQIVKHIGNGSQ